MLLEIAKWSELLSAFAVLLPLISLLYLVIKSGKKHLQFDIVLLSYYSIISLYFQSLLMLTSLLGNNNLWLCHIFIPIELFFFSAILLYYSNEKIFYISVFLSAACFFIVSKFDEPGKLPFLSVLLQFFSILLISPGALYRAISNYDARNIDRYYYSYQEYAIKGILLTVIGNFVFIAFVEKHLVLILFIHSILNIYSNYLFARTYKCYSETNL